MGQEPANHEEQERLSLSKAAQYLLEECRTVLPGMQALFGFQLIAVFSQTFKSQLSQFEQRIHLLALSMVAIAIALLMTPAAIHRRTGARWVTAKFIDASARLLLLSMLPLLIGICLDLYLIARIILSSVHLAMLIALFVFIIFATLWFIFPRSKSFRSPGKHN